MAADPTVSKISGFGRKGAVLDFRAKMTGCFLSLKRAGLLGWLLLLTAGCASDPSPLFQGYVEGEYQLIASPLSGHLQSLPVSRGMTVAAGAPLFTLEQQNEAAAVAEAEQGLRLTESRLADLGKGLRPSEIAALRAALAQAEAAANLAGLEFARRAGLFAENAISREELERARKEKESSAAAVTRLKAELETAGLGARLDEIQAARAEVGAARERLAQARWRLAQKTRQAPDAGLVFDTFYVAGEFVPAGYPVLSILPPGNIKIRFFVPETVAGSLAPGQPVTITADGAAAPLRGTISYISPRAEYTPPVIYSRETRAGLVFMIEARLVPGQAAMPHPGQPVEVRLEKLSPVSDHRAPHLATIGPAHVQKYASPSRLPQPVAPCGRLFRDYLTFVGLLRDRLPSHG